MKHSLKVGFCFGLTSGIITTLGLMVGLYSGTYLKLVVIGGILTIAIADSFSDAIGIHITEEAENKHTTKEIWESTFSTFICKFIIATSFIIPVLLMELKTAVIISLIYGFALLSILSYFLAKGQKKNAVVVILEHLIIAVVVIILAYYVGYFIKLTFT